MNLYQLKKEIDQLKSYLIFYKNKLGEIDERMTSIKISTITAERVQGGTKENRTDYYIMNKDYCIDKIIAIECELKSYIPLLNQLEATFKEFNDKDRQIYFDYHINGYNADKLAMKYHYSRSQIYNIINRVNDQLKIRQN